MVKINIQKKDLWLLSAIMVFLVGVAFVIAYAPPVPNPSHEGDRVFIYINGFSKDLQQAIDDEDFGSSFNGGGSYSRTIVHGHTGKEIIVNIGGNIKNFQEAINDGSLSSVKVGTSPSNFGSIVYGNNGDEIGININGQEKTLQQAINDEDFMPLPTAYVSVGMSRKQAFRTWDTATALVTVRENTASGLPIVGVTVQGTWSGDYSAVVFGATNANGQFSFTTDWIATSQTVRFTVNTITKNGDIDDIYDAKDDDIYELAGTLSGTV